MPRFMISVLAIFVILTLGFILLALSGYESSPEPLQEPIQYPNEETTGAPGERTTSNYEVQYPSELPDTSGIRLW